MLREAVASVLTQTWQPLEIIIVDDGSTDDTRNVATELSLDHPEIIRVLHQQNAGPGVARQTGFEASRGEFIQFLDSDDLLLPNKFKLQVSGLRDDPEAGISYGRTYVRVNDQRLPRRRRRDGEKHRELFPVVLIDRIWDTSTPLYRRSALEKIGPWSARRWLEDWEFDARAGGARIKLNYCDEYISESVEHNEPRLYQLSKSPGAMRDAISVHIAVLGYAQRAGIARNSPEMQQFADNMFMMARRANHYGMPQEAKDLFDLALLVCLKPRWDYRLFGVTTSVLGWNTSCYIARFAKNAFACISKTRNVKRS
jgi:glycosyltransferase involved in cell wall biosynthesis